MKIKLFEEHNELNFSQFNLVRIKDFNFIKKLKLTDIELSKIQKYFIFQLYEDDYSRDLTNYHYTYTDDDKYRKEYHIINLFKLEDDYYLLLYRSNEDRSLVCSSTCTEIKCDQLSDLLKVLKYIKNNIYEY